MKTYTLILALALPAFNAAAAWEIVNEHAEYVAYVDRASIARNGDLVRMDDLVDFKVRRVSPYGIQHQSSLAQSEFDCRAPRMRTVTFVLHAGPMGEGEVVEEVAPSSGWMPVFDGTLLHTLRTFACR